MRLSWSPANQSYETGVDHGVLYPETGPGVVWNGLLAVEESSNGGEVESLYFDGRKYLDVVRSKEFKAKLKAYSAPKAFAPCLGQATIRAGVYLTQQHRETFGLSYRTKLGSSDYKIHLVYNALASASARSYKTMGATAAPNIFDWDLSTTAINSTLYKPTAHFVLDSTKLLPNNLNALETILYGTDLVAPRLPNIAELLS